MPLFNSFYFNFFLNPSRTDIIHIISSFLKAIIIRVVIMWIRVNTISMYMRMIFADWIASKDRRDSIITPNLDRWVWYKNYTELIH